MPTDASTIDAFASDMPGRASVLTMVTSAVRLPKLALIISLCEYTEKVRSGVLTPSLRIVTVKDCEVLPGGKVSSPVWLT